MLADPSQWLVEGLSSEEQIEHLLWVIEELTAPPPDWAEAADEAGLALTPSEARVFGLLARRSGRVVSRESLMTALTWERYGEDGPEYRIIDQYVCFIRRKMREADLPWTIRAVRSVGYCLEGM